MERAISGPDFTNEGESGLPIMTTQGFNPSILDTERLGVETE